MWQRSTSRHHGDPRGFPVPVPAVSTEVRELQSGSPSIISISQPSNCLLLLTCRSVAHRADAATRADLRGPQRYMVADSVDFAGSGGLRRDEARSRTRLGRVFRSKERRTSVYRCRSVSGASESSSNCRRCLAKLNRRRKASACVVCGRRLACSAGDRRESGRGSPAASNRLVCQAGTDRSGVGAPH